MTLVRDGIVTGPTLALQSYATNSWTFTGSNAIPLIRLHHSRLYKSGQLGRTLRVTTSSVSGTFNFTDTNAWRYPRRFYNVTN